MHAPQRPDLQRLEQEWRARQGLSESEDDLRNGRADKRASHLKQYLKVVLRKSRQDTGRGRSSRRPDTYRHRSRQALRFRGLGKVLDADSINAKNIKEMCFFRHPKKVCMTYLQHARVSRRLGCLFAKATVTAFVHAIWPDLFTTSSHDAVHRALAIMEDAGCRKKRDVERV